MCTRLRDQQLTSSAPLPRCISLKLGGGGGGVIQWHFCVLGNGEGRRSYEVRKKLLTTREWHKTHRIASRSEHTHLWRHVKPTANPALSTDRKYQLGATHQKPGAHFRWLPGFKRLRCGWLPHDMSRPFYICGSWNHDFSASKHPLEYNFKCLKLLSIVTRQYSRK